MNRHCRSVRLICDTVIFIGHDGIFGGIPVKQFPKFALSSQNQREALSGIAYRPETVFVFAARNEICKLNMIKILVFAVSEHSIAVRNVPQAKAFVFKVLCFSAVDQVPHVFQKLKIAGTLLFRAFFVAVPRAFQLGIFFSLNILIPRIPRPHPKSVPLQIPPPQDTLRLLPHLRAFLCGRERFLLQIPISRHWSGENLFRFL